MILRKSVCCQNNKMQELDIIISRSRKLFENVLKIKNYRGNPGDSAGLCGVSQSCIYYSMLDMGIDPNRIKLFQLSPIFYRYCHACIGYLQEGGDMYILDLTFTQFMKDWDIPGLYFNKLGYIKLTPFTVKWMYSILNNHFCSKEQAIMYLNLFKNPSNQMLLPEPDHDRTEIIW